MPNCSLRLKKVYCLPALLGASESPAYLYLNCYEPGIRKHSFSLSAAFLFFKYPARDSRVVRAPCEILEAMRSSYNYLLNFVDSVLLFDGELGSSWKLL